MRAAKRAKAAETEQARFATGWAAKLDTPHISTLLNLPGQDVRQAVVQAVASDGPEATMAQFLVLEAPRCATTSASVSQ